MKKKMSVFCAVMSLVLVMAGCAKNEEVTEDVQNQEEVTEKSNQESGVIMPLPSTVDVNDLSDCMVSVSFDKEDIVADEDDNVELKVKVWTYDLYDMVDISMLSKGVQNE